MPSLTTSTSLADVFDVGPSPLELVWTVYVLSITGALIVCAVKGRWGWFVVGLVTLGIGAYVGATRSPIAGSSWARLSDRRARRDT